jgi:2-oxoglutarate ferredoxin oxidoreductase subunit delta
MPERPPASAPDAAQAAARPASSRDETAPREGRATVLVDLDLCKACGICIALCPTTVFDRGADGQAVVARPEDCTACRLCELHCPDFAIDVLARGADTPGASSAAGEDA